MTDLSAFTELAYVAWAVIFFVWLAHSFGNKHTVKTPHLGEQILVLSLMFIGFGLVFNQRHIPGVLGEQLFYPGAQSGILGTMFSFVGAAFAVWARFTLGKNWSGATVTIKKDHKLIETGPYFYVRHPIYSGFLTAAIGTAFTVGTLAIFLSVPFLLGAFLIRIRREEEMLTAQFPGEYPGYITRTKALVPYLF